MSPPFENSARNFWNWPMMPHSWSYVSQRKSDVTQNKSKALGTPKAAEANSLCGIKTLTDVGRYLMVALHRQLDLCRKHYFSKAWLTYQCPALFNFTPFTLSFISHSKNLSKCHFNESTIASKPFLPSKTFIWFTSSPKCHSCTYFKNVCNESQIPLPNLLMASMRPVIEKKLGCKFLSWCWFYSSFFFF